VADVSARGRPTGPDADTSLDVVVIPDFAGPAASRFEARTLFFLASWLERGGAARRFPLHVAAIGEPPRSVRRLARECGASVQVFPPLGIDRRGAANKLRGLDVDTDADRLLLLDADVLVLSDFSDVADLGCALAATPAIRARVPAAYWPTIYRGLGLAPPDERMTSLVGRLRCGYTRTPNYPEQNAEAASMPPYYNSGVLLAPRTCGLRPLWEDHVRRIASLFAPDATAHRAVTASDQAGLATAIECLRSRGVPFVPMPEPFNACWLHLYRRSVPLAGVRLFHALGLFISTCQIGWQLPVDVSRYQVHLMRRLYAEWRHDPESTGSVERFRQYLAPAWHDADRLGRFLRMLYRKHVRPAMRSSVN
jgi:hypothetical protein